MGLVARIQVQPPAAGSGTGGVVIRRRIDAVPAPARGHGGVNWVIPDQSTHAVVKKRPCIVQSDRPALARVLTANLDVIGFVIYRLHQFGDVVLTGTGSEVGAEGAFANVVVGPVSSRKRPARSGGILDVEPGDAVIDAKIHGSRLGVYPLANDDASAHRVWCVCWELRRSRKRRGPAAQSLRAAVVR